MYGNVFAEVEFKCQLAAAIDRFEQDRREVAVMGLIKKPQRVKPLLLGRLWFGGEFFVYFLNVCYRGMRKQRITRCHSKFTLSHCRK